MILEKIKCTDITNKSELRGFRIAERVRLLRKFYRLLYAAYNRLGEDKFAAMLRVAANRTGNSTSAYEFKRVSNYIGIPIDELNKKTRKREVVESRQVAMYLAKLNTKESLAVIGRTIGNKDHATVLHACKTVNNLLQTDVSFRNKWKALIEI